VTENADQSDTGQQQTLFGDSIPIADDTAAEPNPDDDGPPEKPCDVCDRTVPIF
jgi:hypothetical protein